MSVFQDFWQFVILDHLGPLSRGFTESFTTRCDSGESGLCRDDSAAFSLKFAAIASILLAGAAGVSLPLVGTLTSHGGSGRVFMGAKAFAAGVILATGFVHMLPGGSEALSDPCLPEYPWRSRFPFPGFFAMVAALLTLLADFLITRYYEGKRETVMMECSTESLSRVEPEPGVGGVGSGLLESGFLGEEGGSGLPIVGMRAENRRHSLSLGEDSFRALGKSSTVDGAGGHGGDDHDRGHGHGHGHGDAGLDSRARHVVVSQILELGIVSHSIIIGLSLGVSHSPCTIRPLIAALSFHQFFEGFALGGCISEAKLPGKTSAAMACFFAVTAPLGVAVGMAAASQYNAHSVAALVAEGVLDSLSAGILVYMALVDLIAADFLNKRMSLNFRLQLVSYLFLFLGAALMSLLAIWA